MRATVMHQARDVRIENVPDAAIWEPNGAGAPQTRMRVGTHGRRHRGCRPCRFMGGRRIEQRSHRRVPRLDSAVVTQAEGDVT
jgi:hypothetical protein